MFELIIKSFFLSVRYLCVYPKGKIVDDHLSLFLNVVNFRKLLPGWKRQASFSFVVLNQSGKELHRTVGKIMI